MTMRNFDLNMRHVQDPNVHTETFAGGPRYHPGSPWVNPLPFLSVLGRALEGLGNTTGPTRDLGGSIGLLGPLSALGHTSVHSGSQYPFPGTLGILIERLLQGLDQNRADRLPSQVFTPRPPSTMGWGGWQ